MTKILVVGCGTIGVRHVRNLRNSAIVGIVDNDQHVTSQIAQESEVLNFGTDLRQGLAWRPQGVVVATPSKNHVQIANEAILHGADVLVEKPIGLSTTEVEELLNKAEKLQRKVFVVCNLRYHPGVTALREHLPTVGKILFARARYGSYLPEMRPGKDYSKMYVASSDEGGVVLDSIHEIDYLNWIFGSSFIASASSTKLSDLEIKAEDYSNFLLCHRSGVRSEVHLDYLSPLKMRGCEVVGERGIVKWLSLGKTPEKCEVTKYTRRDGWEMILDQKIARQDVALKSVTDEFVRIIRAEKSSNVRCNLQTGAEALKSLSQALQIRRLSDEPEF